MRKLRENNFCSGKSCRGRFWALTLAVVLTGIMAVEALAVSVFAAAESRRGAQEGEQVITGGSGFIDSERQTVVRAEEARNKRKAAQKLKINLASKKIAVGKTTTVRAKNVKGGAKVTYQSLNEDVAAVSADGKVTAKKAGKATIKVTTEETLRFREASKSVILKVVPAATASLKAQVLDTGIRLVWEKVDGASAYYLYRDGSLIKKITGGTTVVYTDLKANKKKTYKYKLTAWSSVTGLSTLSKTVSIKRTKKGGQATAPSDQGGNDQGGNSQGGNDQGGNDQGGNDQGGNDQGGVGQGGNNGNDNVTTAPSGVRYCFEKKFVAQTLLASKKGNLAVIDTTGIANSTIKAALDRGVKVYGYLNAGSLETDRKYYNQYKKLSIAEYDGWDEYWVDVTDPLWKAHLIDEAKKIKATGATGVYLDNLDILYMVEEGFREDGTKMLSLGKKRLSDKTYLEKVYKALSEIVKTIQKTVGLTVMPNGGDTFVERFIEENKGFIKEVNQESVLYIKNRAQKARDTKYLTKYLNWCKNQGIIVRGIEYINTEAGAQKAVKYYEDQGWKSVYISKKNNLKGD